MPITQAPPGGAQGLIIEPTPIISFQGGIGVLTQNAAYLVKFRLARAALISKIAIVVGTANGNVDVGIHSLSGSTYNLLGHSGATAAAGSNAIQELAMLANIALSPGVDYWASLTSDGATLTILRQSMGAAVAGAYASDLLLKTSHYSSGLQSTLSSPANGSIAPWLALTSAI